MNSSLRDRLLGALAAGLALSCKSNEHATAVPALPSPEPSVAPAGEPTRDASAVPPAPELAEIPDSAVEAEASSADPPVPRCPAGTKPQQFCLGVGEAMAKMVPNYSPKFDRQGCALVRDVNDSCAGIRAVLSGPTVNQRRCCYQVCRGQAPPCGRWLLDDRGQLRTAERVERRDWSDDDTQRLPPAVRRAFLQDALLEHASVAAFARFSLELLAIGAPATLVADAHRAALDEIAHAELCFGLAAAPGEAHGPGPLSLAGLTPRTHLADIVEAVASECCAGETFAAALARRALARCTHPRVSAVLRRIADDEARHAELGWKFVIWALHSSDDPSSLRAAIEAGLDDGRRRIRAAHVEETADLGAFGRLPPKDIAIVVQDALTLIDELAATLQSQEARAA